MLVIWELKDFRLFFFFFSFFKNPQLSISICAQRRDATLNPTLYLAVYISLEEPIVLNVDTAISREPYEPKKKEDVV